MGLNVSDNLETFSVGTYPAVKSYRMGCPSGLAFGPAVGGNRRNIGAVCNIS
jgi:hypothetical protein